MATTLNGLRIAILAADGVERVELERPRQALEDAGARTVVVSISSGQIRARDHDLEDAGTFAVDQLVGALSVDDYEALLLPGGTVNPEKRRMEPAAVQFVRDFVQSGKLVASICHGPWSFVEADVARGRRLTSWPSVRTDLRNAGPRCGLGGERGGRHRRQHHDEPVPPRPAGLLRTHGAGVRRRPEVRQGGGSGLTSSIGSVPSLAVRAGRSLPSSARSGSGAPEAPISVSSCATAGSQRTLNPC